MQPMLGQRRRRTATARINTSKPYSGRKNIVADSSGVWREIQDSRPEASNTSHDFTGKKAGLTSSCARETPREAITAAISSLTQTTRSYSRHVSRATALRQDEPLRK